MQIKYLGEKGNPTSFKIHNYSDYKTTVKMIKCWSECSNAASSSYLVHYKYDVE